jgi:hypothetical protein
MNKKHKPCGWQQEKNGWRGNFVKWGVIMHGLCMINSSGKLGNLHAIIGY